MRTTTHTRWLAFASLQSRSALVRHRACGNRRSAGNVACRPTRPRHQPLHLRPVRRAPRVSGSMAGSGLARTRRFPTRTAIATTSSRALKRLEVPVVRWPGGCFADEYHWREGVGPRDKRPVRVNTHWGGVEEPNSFGTHEFMNFAELIGADAYVSGNVGDGTPEEMAQWVEYITSDTASTLAKRAPQERPRQALEASLLWHRQRAVGLRRQHARRIRRGPRAPLSDFREGSARISAAEDRRRRERRRLSLDRSVHARDGQAR